jgi:hypothetical protein
MVMARDDDPFGPYADLVPDEGTCGACPLPPPDRPEGAPPPSVSPSATALEAYEAAVANGTDADEAIVQFFEAQARADGSSDSDTRRFLELVRGELLPYFRFWLECARSGMSAAEATKALGEALECGTVPDQVVH